jgi:hypothetical protein
MVYVVGEKNDVLVYHIVDENGLRPEDYNAAIDGSQLQSVHRTNCGSVYGADKLTSPPAAYPLCPAC